ncbi:MAG: DUF6572 domain-containing protein [Candidatus Thiodiazotropha sp.]
MHPRYSSKCAIKWRANVKTKKINRYPAFALDGQLANEYPDMAKMKLKLQIEIQHAPEDVVYELLKNVRPHIESEGIKFNVEVGIGVVVAT